MDVSNPDRVIFPESGFTKADLVAHYRRVAPRMVPHLDGRPLTLHRFPAGIHAPGFLQKNASSHFPAFVARVEVPKKGGVTTYPVVHDAEALLYLANQGTVTFHAWTSRVPDLYQPDRVVFDLDPPEGAVAAAAAAARLVGEALDLLGLPSAPMTTGSKGYHVVVPVTVAAGYDRVARFAQGLAALLAARHPSQLTDEFKIAKRAGRVFVDWLRNTSRATGVVAWSLRARPAAPVAVPFRWDELNDTPPQRWTLATLDEVLDHPDPIAALPPADLLPALDAVEVWLAASGVELRAFDRFRS